MKRDAVAHWAFLAMVLVCLGSDARAAVGRTAGFYDVSQAGTAQYTIPLWTPPAAGGVHPSLAITYSHARDNGILGMGFDVSGFSAIGRCSKTIAQDGENGPVEMLAADAYCIDGNRLRLKSGTHGVANSTYGTELETYTHLIAKGAVGATGPAWFEAWRKDGLIYEYGNSLTSQIGDASGAVRVWALNAIRDRSGNRVEFTYHEDGINGAFHPDTISYATNLNAGVTVPPYQIQFIYETRTDPIYGYHVSGSHENELKRLTRIEMRHAGSLAKIYKFQYETSGGAGGRSRLTSLQECSTSTSAADCLGATQFTWTSNSGVLLAEQNPSQVALSLHLIDIDGDGRDDMVYPAGSGSGTWRFRKLVQPEVSMRRSILESLPMAAQQPCLSNGMAMESKTCWCSMRATSGM